LTGLHKFPKLKEKLIDSINKIEFKGDPILKIKDS
jgi:hypothetical protein